MNSIIKKNRNMYILLLLLHTLTVDNVAVHWPGSTSPLRSGVRTVVTRSLYCTVVAPGTYVHGAKWSKAVWLENQASTRHTPVASLGCGLVLAPSQCIPLLITTTTTQTERQLKQSPTTTQRRRRIFSDANCHSSESESRRKMNGCITKVLKRRELLT